MLVNEMQEDVAMQNKIFLGLGVVFLLLMTSVFTVFETEKAIKFQLGRIVKSDYTPGIYFKIPVINNIKKLDGRIQTMAEKPERFLTAEKKNVIVDLFVKWKIDDKKVGTFYTAVGGDIAQANLRLNQDIKNAIRSEFSKRNIKQLVSTDRSAIRDILMEQSKSTALKLGIDIVDVQVMRIDLPEEVSESVFRRMEAERESIARRFRSEGSEQAEKIRAEADKERTIELANAFSKAETLRGEGDAIAADTYSKAYGQDAEFFTFYRSLNAYKKTFSKSGMMVIDPHSDFFQYLNKQK
ncbi:Modulator of FtsH protease HflC [Patescibacteria group bacterium]|nr:Modulator of FtsH protease HflC [Patescibacteria group bacterium]